MEGIYRGSEGEKLDIFYFCCSGPTFQISVSNLGIGDLLPAVTASLPPLVRCNDVMNRLFLFLTVLKRRLGETLRVY